MKIIAYDRFKPGVTFISLKLFPSRLVGGIDVSRVGRSVACDVDNDRFVLRLGEVCDAARLAVEATVR